MPSFSMPAALSDAEMQDLARETNLSETTFICRRDAGYGARAGRAGTHLHHAGRAAVCRASHAGYGVDHPRLSLNTAGAEKIVLDLNAGQVPVGFPPERERFATRLWSDDAAAAGLRYVLHDPRRSLRCWVCSVEDLLHGADAADGLDGAALLRVPSAVRRSAEPHACAGHESRGLSREAQTRNSFYAIAADGTTGNNAWRARMQFYNGEDPATGSAAGCAISYLVRHGVVGSGEQVHLRQGVEIHRPSDLYISANSVDGQMGEVRVGGQHRSGCKRDTFSLCDSHGFNKPSMPELQCS